MLFERRTLERELEDLGVDEETGSSTTLIDELAAEPIFSDPVRTRIDGVLDASAVAKAAKYNEGQHPKVSGVALADLRRRLEQYIDRRALEAALKKAGADQDDGAMTAQLAYQFQRKCFRESVMQTGSIGESTLDALGFVRHGGKKLNRADRENSAAGAILQKVLTPELTKHLGPDVNAKSWFGFMLDAPFLGLTTRGATGLHLELVRRLRRAQRHLQRMPKYRDLTPVELGDTLLWDPKDDPRPHPSSWYRPKDPDAKLGDRHRGGRPGTGGASMHLPGLAVDLGYRTNPWVGSLSFKEVSGRAASLVGGMVTGLDGKQVRAASLAGELRDAHGLGRNALHTLAQGKRTTTQIYDALASWNEWLETYLALQDSTEQLAATLEARRADGTPGVFTSGESIASAVKRWRTRIRADEKSLEANSFAAAGTRRPARRGFLSFHRDLVVALRDEACLAWGAVDIGKGAKGSGDIMHFDCRVDGIGRAFARGTGKSSVPTVHPCLKKDGELDEERELDEELAYTTVPTKSAGQLLRFKSRAAGATTAVFVPAHLTPGADPVTVLIWIHGLLVCGDEGSDAVSYVRSKLFPLCEILAASRRPYVLAVPSMRWRKGQETHALDQPRTMNALVDEVREGLVRAGWPAPPSVGRLVLAGHSKAYVVLDRLGARVGAAASSEGALAKLTDVWSVDSFYSARAPKRWLNWALMRPNVAFKVLYRQGTGTACAAECLRAHVDARAAGTKPKERLCGYGKQAKRRCECDSTIAGRADNITFKSFEAKRVGHCALPAAELPLLLDGAETT